MKNLVVIPAYNEEKTIREVVERALTYSDVLVVDDASKDKTPEILKVLIREYPKRLFTIRHEKNTHIPGGIQDGMKFAVEKKYDSVVTMDAGLSHDPNKLPEFIKVEADLVIGSRITTVGVPFYRKLISFIAAKVMNYCISPGLFDVFGYRLRDCTSGYRKYSKKAFTWIAQTELESIAFDFHMEALSIVAKNQGTIREIGIHYVFSNSSFNRRVLKQAIQFALKLLKRKLGLDG
ncbi:MULTISPECIES: glycosyltransferase family 2 protein [Leptospira]|uniref:Glycosyltransferase, group 2 family protein n=3 Tax=Leptospira borgpetersenii TaxID=174 RepID=A0ABN0I0C8_LEPBO|nr:MULTISPECIES: glycosyltransferase family 2 protein [Leptospira]AXX15094.1 glycosyltransferase family 2 protein [Leptospira borgpetersenii serovar Ceylonica]EKP14508.1 glycosyltransferase, group 2 family protein [Leptospira borgpetersenii str. 200801926]EKQ92357.1 glycosyltransferase, group 2 family protein [Leptospira borgpetersenii str. UI 09149]EMK12363.1 glycosyltransferase, group 2 family protein [Leptospira sp. serovar Kenya str. Sh9]EMN11184.1 glycosyltransferase, group 2 family prote